MDFLQVLGKAQVLFDFLGRKLLEARHQGLVRNADAFGILDIIPALVQVEQTAAHRRTVFKLPAELAPVVPRPNHVSGEVALAIPALAKLADTSPHRGVQLLPVKALDICARRRVDMVPHLAVGQRHLAVHRPPVSEQAVKEPTVAGRAEPPALAMAGALVEGALIDAAIGIRAKTLSLHLPADKLAVIVRSVLQLEKPAPVVLMPRKPAGVHGSGLERERALHRGRAREQDGDNAVRLCKPGGACVREHGRPLHKSRARPYVCATWKHLALP